MNKIKHIMLLVLMIGSVFLLTACDYEYYLYHGNIRVNTEVEKVELISYSHQNSTDNSEDNLLFDDEKLVLIETLDSNNNQAFLSELSEIGGLSSKLEQTIESPNGTGIMITYQDDGFTLITVSNENDVEAIFVGHYDTSSNVEGFYGISWPDMIDDFKDLLVEYFDTNMDSLI